MSDGARRQPGARDVVVVGASAGGLESLRVLLSGLPATLAATVLVVLHIPDSSPGILSRILDRDCPLPVSQPTDGQELRPGRVLIAPADRHLVVVDGRVLLSRGPRENGQRPAIDVLFRSAAHAHGRRVIAVVLSGTLDDGTAGAVTVRARSGLVVVQDPADAAFGQMPQSVIDHATADHVAPVADLGPLIARLCAGAPVQDKDDGTDDDLPAIPGAGEGWPGEGVGPQRAETLEHALWAAIRALDEKAALNHRLADRAVERDNPMSAERFLDQARDMAESAALVRRMMQLPPAGPVPVLDGEWSRPDES